MSNLAKVPFFTGLRRLFYAVSVNETSFQDVEDVPQYITEATPFFFVCMFLEIAISAIKHDNKIRLADGATSVSAGTYSRLPYLLVKSVHLLSYVWTYEHFRVMELPWDSAWTWWLTFLGVDLGYYWFHRLAHEVNFMWAAHQVHHSSEDYNLSTALRQSVLQTYTSWIFYLPLALFIPPSVFMVHNELNILYQFWIHTQYIKSLGPLEYILNTPSHHRVHHGRNPYCIDKNYAGTLIIWDRLFGTFQAEDEEVVYGLTHPVATYGPGTIQFGYLQYMLDRFWNIEGLKNKLCVIFCGPGWSPGKPRLGDIEDIPKVKAPWPKYDVVLPGWVSVYATIHFFITLIITQEVTARVNGMSQIAIICCILYIGFSLISFGKIFDNKSSAPYFEAIRCLLTLIGDVAMSSLGYYGTPGYRPKFLYFLQGFFALSFSLWVLLGYKMHSSKVEKRN